MGLLRWLTQSDAPGSGAGSHVWAALVVVALVVLSLLRRR